MAIKAGSAGSFRIGSVVVLEMDAWSLDFGPDLEETHAFGDAWKESTPTMLSFSGSASGRYDPADSTGHIALVNAAMNGTSVAGRFYEDGTKYYSGSAFVKTAITAPTGGVITASYTFTGTGALSYV
ncbi:MAG: hypothetical protein JW388_0275 [Nitrospira sp.]|nr:hypothetical protein [Nitrospira sp.]